MSATMSAYTSAKDAGIRAYDEVFAAAIESGAGQEEAIGSRTRHANAQQEASAQNARREEEEVSNTSIANVRWPFSRRYAAGNAEGAACGRGEGCAGDTELAWDLSLRPSLRTIR